MLRVQRTGSALTLVSRLARPRVLAVLAGALAGLAVAAWSWVPPAGWALGAAAALVVLLGGRAVRARFEPGRVRVRPALPFQREEARPLAEFAAARVETVGEARRRKAERLARQYQRRGGGELPDWLRPPDAPGTNDHLRRIVLVARAGEPLAVTAWLADDELGPALAELAGLLSGG
jgi:hypothetical protein